MTDTNMGMPDLRQSVRENPLTLSARIAAFRNMAVPGEGNASGVLPHGRFLVKASGARAHIFFAPIPALPYIATSLHGLLQPFHPIPFMTS